MTIEEIIAGALKEAVEELYGLQIEADPSGVQKTRKEFEGDFTVVVFPYVKAAKKSPETVAREIGDKISDRLGEKGIAGYTIVKGFLNFSLADSYWMEFFRRESDNKKYGITSPKKEEGITLIEYSSPNTNKPLHLGHIRNNLLGHSVSLILEACGKRVVKANLINDRGIHICKSMLAWLKYGNGETPESSGLKGDHLVGKYYVEFDKHYKEEVRQLTENGMDAEEAAKKAPLMLEAQQMLLRWEKGDPEVRDLWGMMNGWVYGGFNATYSRLGVSFDKVYYESETYLLGKDLVEKGLENGAFYKKEDGSVWADLTGEGMDEKLLLRGDGTSVYITQDLGTAQLRYEEFQPQSMIYVVGNEQIYHFDVLKAILERKLHLASGKSIYHLSYGMVELPDGKMKSREGTVVDADDLMDEMFLQAKESTEALGKFDFQEEEAKNLYEMIGLGALKYFILKVDPKKNMLFNPAESIDFNGNTAPFIQYTHARIRSLLRKAAQNGIKQEALAVDSELDIREKELIKKIYDFPSVVKNAGEAYSPAHIANYVYDLSKEYNRFYQEIPILREENDGKRDFRLDLSRFVASVIRNSMALLGIDVPEKM